MRSLLFVLLAGLAGTFALPVRAQYGFSVEIFGSGSGTDVDSVWDDVFPGAAQTRCDAPRRASQQSDPLEWAVRLVDVASDSAWLFGPLCLDGILPSRSARSCLPEAFQSAGPIGVCRAACGRQRDLARRDALFREIFECGLSLTAPEPVSETEGDRLLAQALGLCTPGQIDEALRACLAACDGEVASVPVCGLSTLSLVGVGGR